MEGQQSLFKGRDRRKRGWFWMDNEYLNGYAKYFGPIGTSVYLSLCRHADNETQKCFPAIELIAEEIGASENTVLKYIKLFEKYRLIFVEREKDPRTNRQLNNIYTLMDKEEWLKPEKSVWKESRLQPLQSESRPQPLSEPTATVEKSRPQPLRYKETHREGDSFKETHMASPSGDADRVKKSVIATQKYFTEAYEKKFGSKPAINFGKDYTVVRKIIGLFKTFDEIKFLIDAFLASEKAERVGPTLSICFSEHTINSWKAGQLIAPLKTNFSTTKV